MELSVGVAGGALTIAVVVLTVEVQPATVAVTLYTPVADEVAARITGVCALDVKLFGPVQLYVAPATLVAVKNKLAPAHIGPEFVAVTAAGVAFTTAIVALANEEQPAIVATTL